MIFEKCYGDKTLDLQKNQLITREAVRAILHHDGKILMIQTHLGDYKFPGGGVKNRERFEDALQREIQEETGFVHIQVKKRIGHVIERKLDQYVENTYFQMNSHYYLVELTNFDQVDQQLDNYELEQQFIPKWVSIDEAINQNELILTEPNYNGWVKRETEVLKLLRENYTKILAIQ